MQTKVQTWGNSLGTRIPASFAAQLHLKHNSLVDLRLEGDTIVITAAKQRYTLDELLVGLTPDNKQAETSTSSVGNEAW